MLDDVSPPLGAVSARDRWRGLGASSLGRLWLLCAFAAAWGGFVGCSDERLQQTPVLSLEPAAFLFAKQEIGQAETRRVTVTNRGNLDLVLKNIRLREESGAGEFVLFVEDASGSRLDAPPSTLTIAKDEAERITLVVTYAPKDDNTTADAATVVFETNDPEQLTVSIPVVSGGQGAELIVSPNAVTFDGRVTVGTTVTEDVLFQNIGVSDLVVADLRIDGAQSEVSVAVIDPPLGSPPFADPFIIEPSQSATVRITYTPTSLAGLSNTALVVVSNDVQAEERRVPISGSSGASCINVLPDPIEFGSALVVDSRNGPTPNLQGITIESCGAVELRVDRIEFEGDAFGLTAVFEPE